MSTGVSGPSVWTPAIEQPDLFVRFAQRRLLEGFARLDDAAGKRNLAAVPPERVGANGQDEMSDVVERKEQEQAGGVADAGGVDARRPFARRHRREAALAPRALAAGAPVRASSLASASSNRTRLKSSA